MRRRERRPWQYGRRKRRDMAACCMHTDGVKDAQRRGLKRGITMGIKGRRISCCCSFA
jgi:hypothetical protein